jgi:hypothetical protein
VNMFPFVCHMAHLDNKGSTLFRSKIVFATSNLLHLNPQSIVQPEAVKRRFELSYMCVPKVDYCLPGTTGSAPKDRRLNRALVENEGFDENIYEFMQFHPITEEFTGVILNTVDELVDVIVETYRKKEAQMEKYQAYLTKIAGAPYEAQVGENLSEPLNMVEMENLARAVEADVRESRSASSLSDYRERVNGHRNAERLDLDPAWRPALEEVSTELAPHLIAELEEFNPDVLKDVLQKHAMSEYVGLLRQAGEWDLLVQRAEMRPHRSAMTVAKGTLTRLAGKVRAKVTEIVTKYPSLPYLGVLAAASASLYYVFSFFSNHDDDEEYEGEGNYHTRTRRGGRRGPNRRTKHDPQQIHQAEGGADLNAEEIVKVMLKNMYIVYASDQVTKLGALIMLKGKIAILPNHFICHWRRRLADGRLKADDFITIKNVYQAWTYKIPVGHFLNAKQTPVLKTRDLAVIELPAFVNAHKDTTNWWMPKASMEKKLDFMCQVVLPDDFGRKSYLERVEPVNSFRAQNDGDIWEVVSGFRYDLPTMVGDCGGLLVISDRSVEGKLMGIHTAGGEGIGLASALCREDVVGALDMFPHSIALPDLVHEAQLAPFEPVEAYENPVQGRFLPLVKLNKSVFTPADPGVYRSALYEAWGPTFRGPSRMRPFVDAGGVTIDPLGRALSRYGVEVCMIRENLVNVAMDDWYAKFMNQPSMIKRHAPKVYSYREAIEGIPELEEFGSINRQKSAGFPFIFQPVPGSKGKQRFWGSEMDFDFDNEEAKELERLTMEIEEKAKRGIRSVHVFCDQPKGELRKLAKVREGKTRAFSGSPTPYLILIRMYFGDFIVAQQRGRIDNECLVGINVYSEEWDKLAKRQQEKGPDQVAGDFEGFDTRHHPIRARAWLVRVNRFYGDDPVGNRVREVLFEDLYNSIHMKDDILYVWIQALPSGHGLTTKFNCGQGSSIMRENFMLCHPDGVRGIVDFDRFVNLVVYGDDNELNIAKQAIGYFNQRTMEEKMYLLGHIYGEEKKTGRSFVSRTIEEVTILKRSFRFDEDLGRYVAPHDLEVILDIPYWVHSKQCADQITRDNVDLALRELSMFDKKVFDEWAPKIIGAARERLDYTPKMVDYMLLKEVVVRQDVVW